MRPLATNQPDNQEVTFDAGQAETFERTLEALEQSREFGKGVHRSRVFSLALKLMQTREGIEYLARHASRFDRSGLFGGSDWDQPQHLSAALVRGTLLGGGLSSALEVLSQLRFLAIAEGKAEHEELTPAKARAFLESVLALNLDLLFPRATEAARERSVPMARRIQRLFQFLMDRLGPHGILASLAREADRVMLQRPIMLQHVEAVLWAAEQSLPVEPDDLEGEAEALARLYVEGLTGPTPLSRQHRDTAEFLAALGALGSAELEAEAHRFAESMRRTGLVAPQHAALLRFLNQNFPELVPEALWLSTPGYASYEIHSNLVHELIEVAVHPETARCVYGLHGVLERGILFFRPVAPGMRRLMLLPIHSEVASNLQAASGLDAPPSANVLLLAGTLSVLGQPRGVDQGHNPTCQAARAISLWSQNDAGYLLELIACAARDDEIVMHFEGDAIHSGELSFGLASELHTELDPVSLVLTQHIDRIYMEMSRRTIGRGEDGHKWVNPELHGWWVHRGFAAVIDETTGCISDFDRFIREFYASYHPEFNGGRDLVYAQPCGIATTDHNGGFVGWHAVAIQRVAVDQEGEWRVYFFNPNRDKDQNWGQGVVTSTSDHAEYEGESSLPFAQFASRLYVFHYNLREEGEPEAVPQSVVEAIREAVASSWAAEREWADAGDTLS